MLEHVFPIFSDLLLGVFCGVITSCVLFSVTFIAYCNLKVWTRDYSFLKRGCMNPFDLGRDLPVEENKLLSTSNHVETCMWISKILRTLLFDVEGSELAAVVQERLVSKLSTTFAASMMSKYLGDFNLKNFKLGKEAPIIKSISFSPKEDLIIAFDMEYAGGLECVAYGQAGLKLGKVSSNVSCTGFNGTVFLKFTKLPSPRILISISDMPKFSFFLDLGDKSLGRISRVLTLVLKSLFFNHLMYPNYQAIIFRSGALSSRELLYAPVWKSSRKFIRCHFERLIFSEEIIKSLDAEGGSVFYLISVGKSKQRSEEKEIKGNDGICEVSFVFQMSIPFDQPQIDSMQITIMGRKRRSSRSNALITLSVPFSYIEPNVLSRVKISTIATVKDKCPHCTIEGEVYLNLDPFKVGEDDSWEFVGNTAGGGTRQSSAGIKATEEYLDGINWGNFKLAWRKFRAASIDDIGRSVHLKTMISEIDPDASLEVPITPIKQSASNIQLSSPPTVTSVDSEESEVEMNKVRLSLSTFEVLPKIVASEDVEEVGIETFGWELAMDTNILQINTPLKWNELQLAEFIVFIDGRTPALLRITPEVFIFYRNGGYRTIKFIKRSNIVTIKLPLSEQSNERPAFTIIDIGDVMINFCIDKIHFANFINYLCRSSVTRNATIKLEDLTDAFLSKFCDLEILTVSCEDSKWFIPINDKFIDSAGIISRRICRRATNLRPNTKEITFQPFNLLNLKYEEEQQEEMECEAMWNRSVPSPVRLYLRSYGLLIKNKLTSSNHLIPLCDIQRILRVVKWRSAGFACIPAKNGSFEFFKIHTPHLEHVFDWFANQKIPIE